MTMAPKKRTIISKSVRHDERQSKNGEDTPCMDCNFSVLNLMMICCEENAPYGPAEETANMFMELLCDAYRRYIKCNTLGDGNKNNSELENGKITTASNKQINEIRITIYHAQAMDYPQTPQEWDSYHGIIIPGSLSAAYDTHIEWIHYLMMIIQTEIHAKQRKTLGICFGHQAFAHSFGYAGKSAAAARVAETLGVCFGQDAFGKAGKKAAANYDCSIDGLASKSCIGPIAGRRAFPCTNEGKYLLGGNNVKKDSAEEEDAAQIQKKQCMEMLYTRGDMVKTLPSVGISLCGTDELPNEVCAYFATTDDVQLFQENVATKCLNGMTLQSPTTSLGKNGSNKDTTTSILPYAITFQAHPEYMTPTGTKVNYPNTVQAMKNSGAIDEETHEAACLDAKVHYDGLLNDCLDATISACVVLGWFRH